MAGSKCPENFLRQYRDTHSRKMQTLTAAQFMEIWKHYDTDGELIYFELFHA